MGRWREIGSTRRDGEGDSVVAHPARPSESAPVRSCSASPRPSASPFGVVGLRGLRRQQRCPRDQRVRIDPFTVQEPWRQFVQGAQGPRLKLQRDDRRRRRRADQRSDAGRSARSSNTVSTRRGRSRAAATRSIRPSTASSRRHFARKLETASQAPADISTRRSNRSSRQLDSVEPPQGAVDPHEQPPAVDPDTSRRTRRAGRRSRASAPATPMPTNTTSMISSIELEGLRLAVEETRTT